MIYDGDCGFCLRWVHRWEAAANGRVDFAPFQDPSLSARFPEIPRQNCEKAVQLVEPDGAVSSGAEAVFRALASAPGQQWFLSWYLKSAFFARASEAVYQFVARNRSLFSRLIR